MLVALTRVTWPANLTTLSKHVDDIDEDHDGAALHNAEDAPVDRHLQSEIFTRPL